MAETPHLLILHSADGTEWARALLYPSTWSGSHAEKLADRIISEVAARSCDWTWDDCEEPLQSAGFTIPNLRNAVEYWDYKVCGIEEKATA